MFFEFSPGAASRFDFVKSTGSTNSDLVAAAIANPAEYPSFSVLVTEEQTAGRGRAGRQWFAPAGSSLFASILLRPKNVDLGDFSWLPLIAGAALTEAIRSMSSIEAKIKWPNDVLINGKKVAGILSELIAEQKAVVIGFGVNVYQSVDQLATDSSTSLSLEGVEVQHLDQVLSRILNSLHRSMEYFEARSFALENSPLKEQISKACETIGCDVKVLLPGDEIFTGHCEKIDEHGRLVVFGQGETRHISVGDIVHLRHN